MNSEGKRIRLTLAHQFVSHKSTENSCWSVKSGTNRKKQAADSGRFEMLRLRIRARADIVIPPPNLARGVMVAAPKFDEVW